MAEPRLKPAPFAAELPDDLQWLAEHQGTPYTLESCHLLTRSLPGSMAEHQEVVATKRHQLGTLYIELITHGAVTTLECESLAEFFEKYCGADMDEALEFIRFAKGTTAEQAKAHGYLRALLGLRIAAVLGRKDLGALVAKPFEVIDEEGKKQQLHFTPTTTFAMIRWALRQLKKAAKPAPEKEEPSRAAARRIREMKQIVADHLEEHEALRDVNLRVTLYAGEGRVQHDALKTSEQFVAAGHLYLALAEIR